MQPAALDDNQPPTTAPPAAAPATVPAPAAPSAEPIREVSSNQEAVAIYSGIGAGGLVGVCACALLALCCVRRRKRRAAEERAGPAHSLSHSATGEKVESAVTIRVSSEGSQVALPPRSSGGSSVALPMRTGSSVQIVGHLGEESAPPPPDWPPEPARSSERSSAVVVTSHPSAGGGAPASAPAAGGVRVEALASQDALPALGLGKPLQLVTGKKKLKQPFGAPLAQYATSECYGCAVPQVLVALWAGIVRGDGLRTEGIFRLAGDPNACALAEKALVKNKLPAKLAPETMARYSLP